MNVKCPSCGWAGIAEELDAEGRCPVVACSRLIISPEKPMHPNVVALLAFFEFSHLPDHLKEISSPFHGLAHKMAERLEGPELTAGLRKLLEAKDCMVRAAL